MKILHIWDQAGVACVLAKYQRKAGHDVTVIKTEADDPFGFLKFYGDKYVTTILDAIRDLGSFDVYHLHSYRFAAKTIRETYPKSKIVLEYHGTDARSTRQDQRQHDEDICNITLYSTPDLIEWVPNGIWLPLPIDTDHFKETEHKGGALFMKSKAYDKPDKLPFDYYHVDPVPYEKVPEIFKNFSLYIDIQNHKENTRPIESHSKTGLEALATGMRIYTHNRVIKSGLPVYHRPENVIKRLDYIYNLI